MNKGELIIIVAEKVGISKAAAADAVECVFDCIQNTLKRGDKAAFVGFGTFSTSRRPAREGRNPATGKTIRIAAKTNVKFNAGKSLVSRVITNTYNSDDSKFQKQTPKAASRNKFKSTSINIDKDLSEEILLEESLIRIKESIKYNSQIQNKLDKTIDFSISEIKELNHWIKSIIV